MYEELVKLLRNCASSTWVEDCDGCPYIRYDGTYCMNGILTHAADAIEELDTLLDGVSADNDALCETIERMKKPRWIPVTDRLPDGEVLAFNAIKGSHGYHEYLLGYVGADSESNTGFSCENEGEILMNVTHWMPLPTPPEEET